MSQLQYTIGVLGKPDISGKLGYLTQLNMIDIISRFMADFGHRTY